LSISRPWRIFSFCGSGPAADISSRTNRRRPALIVANTTRMRRTIRVLVLRRIVVLCEDGTRGQLFENNYQVSVRIKDPRQILTSMGQSSTLCS
jgi:hypothetical protein